MNEQMNTTGDMRRFLVNMALNVARGDIDVQKAAVSIKACKEVNTSLYSEIKVAILANEIGQDVVTLGELPLFSSGLTALPLKKKKDEQSNEEQSTNADDVRRAARLRARVRRNTACGSQCATR